jgi:4-hydroxybutyrate dehydrogenase / sulfolactaldehyde 3-reductase
MNGSKRLGFAGLGTMGGPMAQQVLKKHGLLTVYDVDDNAVRGLSDAGAVAAKSPSELAEASDIVITMLPHPDVFREVVLGSNGLARGLNAGAFLIDMSTNGLKAIKAAAAALAKQGVHVIDAPVGKGPWAAEKGELTILMGGDEVLCREVEWVVRMMGSTVYHCGPVGAGQVVKLANNFASCGNMAVLAEAYALAKAGGAKLDVLCEVMPHTSADSWQLRQTLNGKIRKGDFSPMFKLKLARKDMRLIVDMARELGTPIAAGEGILEWYEKGEAAGHGERDWGAIMLVSNPELKSK